MLFLLRCLVLIFKSYIKDSCITNSPFSREMAANGAASKYVCILLHQQCIQVTAFHVTEMFLCLGSDIEMLFDVNGPSSNPSFNAQKEKKKCEEGKEM